MKIWLVDADNQPVELGLKTAELIGWPDKIYVSGLEQNMSKWPFMSIPAHVELDTLVSPKLSDGADVLLAMAVGSVISKITDVVIFSRDGLVAGTLGSLLMLHKVNVLAVSAVPHPGLPYPHLTIPVGTSSRVDFAPPVCQVDLSQEPITIVIGDAPIVDVPLELQVSSDNPNSVVDSIFLDLQSNKVTKAQFCSRLSFRGYGDKARQAILSKATNYRIVIEDAVHFVLREPS